MRFLKMPVSTTGQFLPDHTETVSDKEVQVKFERVSCKYQNNSDRFTNIVKDYACQYARIYAARLGKMRTIVNDRIKKMKDLKNVPVLKLHELSENTVTKHCIIIGTLFKNQQLKPSILKEISEEHNLIPEPVRDRFIDKEDNLVLEDELQRIKLVGDFNINSMISGVVCGVLGSEKESGKFYVDEFVFADCQVQVPRPLHEKDVYICIVSGLGLGRKADTLMPLQLMVDWISGLSGDVGDQESNASIVRVILAGNSLSADCLDRAAMSRSQYQNRNTPSDSVEAIKSLDDILEQIASCCEMDLMPGEFDPANFQLPQQPLHQCMFPKASMYPTFHSVSNPYEMTVEGTRVLGTSGQNLHDIYRFTDMDDPLEILEHTLRWAHVAPTCPDTLGCYPYVKEEPFVIDSCPHVYFASNQAEFKTKLYKGPDGQEVRLVTVPRFSESNTCVLINLKNLDCKKMLFNDLIG